MSARTAHRIRREVRSISTIALLLAAIVTLFTLAS